MSKNIYIFFFFFLILIGCWKFIESFPQISSKWSLLLFDRFFNLVSIYSFLTFYFIPLSSGWKKYKHIILIHRAINESTMNLKWIYLHAWHIKEKHPDIGWEGERKRERESTKKKKAPQNPENLHSSIQHSSNKKTGNNLIHK